jgi:hypothetical protein
VNPQTLPVQLGAKQSLGEAGHWPASKHATHCPLPMQNGIPLGHGFWTPGLPFVPQVFTVPEFAQDTASPDAQSSHWPSFASQRPDLHT